MKQLPDLRFCRPGIRQNPKQQLKTLANPTAEVTSGQILSSIFQSCDPYNPHA